MNSLIRITKQSFVLKLFLLLMGLTLGSVSLSLGNEARRNTVLQALEGNHWSVKPEVFRQMGKGTETILMEILEDNSLSNMYHFRTLEVLPVFPTKSVSDFLQEYIKAQSNPIKLRRAFDSFTKTFPDEQGIAKALATSIAQSSDGSVSEVAQNWLSSSRSKQRERQAANPKNKYENESFEAHEAGRKKQGFPSQ